MISGRPNVLYIDDEINNLQSFKASFRRDFTVFLANSAEEGYDMMSKEQIHVVVVDQRMPGMTGVQFFESILEEFPNSIRVLLTGFADIEAVVDSINRGRVFHYVTKPWVEEHLRSVIEDAYKTYLFRQERDQELNYFVYKASHDLKGPLVSIKGLVELAIKEVDDKESIKKYLSLIDNSVGSLNRTLTDMFEYKRIDQATLKYSKIDFKSLIQDVFDSLSHMKQSKDMSLDVKVDQSGEFISDHGVLTSVVQNLVQNSIKYRRYDSSESFVSVSVFTNDRNALIEVEDNGVGMPEEVLKNIFKMFYRANKETQGSGLGLYIVQMGIEKINGEIRVRSGQREGSTFSITIPNRKDTSILKRENVVTQDGQV